MSVFVHFLNIGQGNMQVIIFPDNFVMVYDCNITDENEESVFKYLKTIMPKTYIDIFVNSHRDADHMRGIKKLNKIYTIKGLWDTGVPASINTPEYKKYMELRRELDNNVWKAESEHHLKSKPYVRVLNGAREESPNPNAHSIVLHIDYNGSSVLLPGDTDAKVWENYIMKESKDTITSSILLASHHGSRSFIDHESYDKYYTLHLQKINPDMTIISVGNNSHGHPDNEVIKYYTKNSKGSDNGKKIIRTDEDGNIRLELKGNGSWSISNNQ